MMGYKISLLLFLSCVCVVRSTELDSLKNLYHNSRPDTNAVNLLNEIIWQSRKAGDIDSALFYFKKAEALATRLSFKKGLATAHRYTGECYLDEGQMTDAIIHFDYAEELFSELKEYKTLGKVLNSKANVFREMGKFPEAMKNYFAAIRHFETVDDTLNIVISKTNLASIYRRLKNYDESLKLFTEALHYFIQTNDPYAGFVYNNIGNLYSDQGKIDESISYFNEALKAFEKQHSKSGMSIAHNNIGLAWILQNNLDEANKSFKAALALKEELKDKKGIANSMNNIAGLLLMQGKKQEAARYIGKSFSLSKQVGAFDLLGNTYRLQCELDSANGNFRGALENYQHYISYRDSVMNKEVVRSGIQQQMQYEFDKREAETQLAQSKKDAIAAEEKRRQTLILWSVIVGLALVFIFALLMFRALRLKQKANKEITMQKQIIEQKQQEILDSIHYARRIQQTLITSEAYFSRHLRRLRKSA